MPATETLLQGATQVTSSLSANYTAGGGTISMAAALLDHGGGAISGPFEILVGRNRPLTERRYFVATPSGSNLTVTPSPGYTDNQNFVTGDLIDLISAWETQRRLRAFALLHTHTGGAGTVDGPVLAHTALTSIGTNTHAQLDTEASASSAHRAASAAVHGLPASVNVVGNRNAAGEFFQRGSVAVSGTLSAATSLGFLTQTGVTFPVAFGSTPVVTLGLSNTASLFMVGANSVSTTGFTPIAWGAATATPTGSIHWHALGV